MVKVSFQSKTVLVKPIKHQYVGFYCISVVQQKMG